MAESVITKTIDVNTKPSTVNQLITVREQTVYFDPPVLFVHPKDEEINADVVQKFINIHQGEIPRYKYLYEMYKGKHEILNQAAKDDYKPDNRLVVNFAKYLVDTFNGYFDGIPIKIMHPDDVINEGIRKFNKRVEMDDNLYEIAKMTSIFGRAYAITYQNEESETCVTYNSPLDMFIVYDDTVSQNPLFAVRYYQSADGTKGEVFTINNHYIIEAAKDGIVLTEDNETAFYYTELPVSEFIENEERTSLFEPIITLNNALNKGLSEKGNDVDYFADAYLAILGAKVDETSGQKMRDNRMINLYGSDEALDATKIVAKFLEKPDADATQENYLDRVERFIFMVSMVVNINDEDFGNSSSGESLMYKLLNMSNLALTKERKFTSSLNKIYKMFFSVPLNFENHTEETTNEWFNLEYKFTRNTPKNVKEEAEIASSLAGVVSKETQLSVLSIVHDPKSEIEKIKLEETPDDPYSTEGGTASGTNQTILGAATGEALAGSGEESS